MERSHTVDPSTLASLTPGQPMDLHFANLKSSQRLQGSYLMALRRPSRTPESSRLYVKGDPTNLIDWKAFARTDQLIIREVRDEASARVVIALDLSETMNWPPTDLVPGAVPPKNEVAMRVALNVAHVHARMGDLVEIWLVHAPESSWPTARFKPRNPADVISLFLRGQETQFSAAAILQEFTPDPCALTKIDVAYWVGDGLGTGQFARFLELAPRRSMLHILSSLETDIQWTKPELCYFDEGRGKKEYQGDVLRFRGNYQHGLQAWSKAMEKQLERIGAAYGMMTDRTEIAWFHRFLNLSTTI